MKHYTINRLGQVLKRTHNNMTKTVGAYYGARPTELLERLRAEAINVPDAEQIARIIIAEFTQRDAMSALGHVGGSKKSAAKTAAARKNAEKAGRKPEITWSERSGCRFTYNDVECIRDHDMQGDRGIIIRGEHNGQSYELFVEFNTALNKKGKYEYTNEISADKKRSAKCIIRRELAKLIKADND